MSEAESQLLASWIRAGTTPQRVVRRARIVLLVAQGMSTRAIAQRLALTPRTVALWRRRFEQQGPDGLWRDAPGRGRKRSIGIDAVSRVRALLESRPPHGQRWSIRALAHATGLSRASVHRIVKAGCVLLNFLTVALCTGPAAAAFQEFELL
jgi:transposase